MKQNDFKLKTSEELLFILINEQEKRIEKLSVAIRALHELYSRLEKTIKKDEK